MRTLLLSAAFAALLAMPAAAHEHEPPPNDEIVLQIRSEAWVETGTARVVAVVEKVLTGDQAGQQDRRVPPVLNELAPNADWRVIGFDRSRDASGLERWRVTAQARLPESALGGIYDRAETISKPGTQVAVTEVAFEPTLAEREATAAKLRADIYRRAAEEAARTAQVWPARGFRVQRVDFLPGAPIPRPMPKMMRAPAAPEAFAASAADMGGDVNVSERMVLTATVVIAAPPPDTEEDGSPAEKK